MSSISASIAIISEDNNKIKNLDSFFDIKKEENIINSGNSSPTSTSSLSLKPDFNELYPSYNFNQEYQYIIEQSKLLQKTEHIEIFKIIDNNGDDYTSNENGVFIALNKLKPETLTQIKQFIEFCIINKSQLQKDLHKRDVIREIMNCQTDEIRGFNKIFLLS
jgi:hypothetical protein